MICRIRAIALCVVTLSAIPTWATSKQCETVVTVDSEYVKNHSKKVEDLLDPEILSRSEELGTKTADTSKKQFSHGQIYKTSQGLIWKDKGGLETILVHSADLEEGYGISEYLVSPDGLKVAYALTYHGQDLKFWNVVKVSKTPSPLLKQPIENRMQGFGWNKNSDGLYYSFWFDKEEQKKGLKPILEVRFRNIETGEDKPVFSPNLAENFGIADVDGGNTLFAYRLLVPSSGIKTTFSLYKGIKQQDGTYKWEKAYPRNKYIGVFLGEYDKKAIILTEAEGDTYGVSAIDSRNDRVQQILPARKNHVLHQAELVGDTLVLEYHSIPEQNVSIRLYNLKTKKSKTFKISDLGLTPFGKLGLFNFAPGSKVSRAVFEDVQEGNQALELNLENQTLKRLPNVKDIDFDKSQMEQKLVEFTTKDGTKISGRLYTRKGETPSFVFMRYYGWISIKNSPEPAEVQMVLELGGAYMTVDMPGGGERGAKWFFKGARKRLKMVKYLSETSTFLQKHFDMGPEKIVAMGRSWGGLTAFVLATLYGKNFGMINAVAPVLDLADSFVDGWFGRISQSDLGPEIDKDGNYILDQKFWDYVASIDPIQMIGRILKGTKINIFTSGLDDRTDQGGEQEALFAKQVEDQVGSDNFYYHRSIKGSHKSRFYQVLIMSLIKHEYGLTYRPMRK